MIQFSGDVGDVAQCLQRMITLRVPRLSTVLIPLIALPLSGSNSRVPEPIPAASKHFVVISEQIHRQLISGNYLRCIAVSVAAQEEARQSGQASAERAFLNSAGICQMSLFQFREALGSLLQARRVDLAALRTSS